MVCATPLKAGARPDSLVAYMPASAPDRRRSSQRSPRFFWDPLFRVLRLIARHAHDVYATFGIFILAGLVVAVAGTWGFAELARHVRAGATQPFDVAVLRWFGARHAPLLDSIMLEITALGTDVVIVVVVGVASMFLWLTRHRHSAALLWIATVGGMLLNPILKHGFDRPRPHIFAWLTAASSYSFPSGHAMNSAVAYATLAYLAARLQKTIWGRLLTTLGAALVILLVCASRLYLGVHYPSDVVAGLVVGLAWAGFCMTTLELAQRYARRNAPRLLRQEVPPDATRAPAEPSARRL